jgi:putative ABC transport system permease protein
MDGVRAVEPFRSVPVRLTFGPRQRRAAITGLPAGSTLSRLIDANQRPVALPREGLVLTTMLADLIGATAGDLVLVEAMEGRRPALLVPVAAVVEEYIGLGAYMDLAALNRMMRDPPVASGAHLLTDAREADGLYRALKETPAAAGIASKTAAVATFRQTMDQTMVTMIVFYALFSSLIALGVVYNSARISLSEHGRELASLRVIGFSKGEVAYILLGQIGLLTLLSLPIGCVIGYGVSAVVAQSFASELFRVPLVIETSTYAFAIVVVLVAALVSAALVAWRIGRLDLIAVLKTRE